MTILDEAFDSLQQRTPVVTRREPNLHLTTAHLIGTRLFWCPACGQEQGRSQVMVQCRKVWQVFRCICGELLRVPPTEM